MSDTKAKSSPTTKQEPKPKAEAVQAQTNPTGIVLSVFALLVSLIVAAAGGYWYWQERAKAQQDNQHAQYIAMQQKVGALGSAQGRLAQQLKQQQEQISKIVKLSAKSTDQTLLLAIQRQQDQLYLSAAKINLDLARALLSNQQDKTLVLSLLSQANRDLAPLGSRAELLSQLINQSIHRASMFAELDPQALDQQLVYLDQHIGTLKLKAPLEKTNTDSSLSQQSQNKTAWKTHLKASWQAIKQYLVIRHDDHLSDHLLYEADRVNAWQAIRVALAEARWAVWHGDQQAYKKAMLNAHNVVVRYTSANQAQEKWLAAFARAELQPVAYTDQAIQTTLAQLSHGIQIINHLLTSIAKEDN